MNCQIEMKKKKVNEKGKWSLCGARQFRYLRVSTCLRQLYSRSAICINIFIFSYECTQRLCNLRSIYREIIIVFAVRIFIRIAVKTKLFRAFVLLL